MCKEVNLNRDIIIENCVGSLRAADVSLPFRPKGLGLQDASVSVGFLGALNMIGIPEDEAAEAVYTAVKQHNESKSKTKICSCKEED